MSSFQHLPTASEQVTLAYHGRLSAKMLPVLLQLSTANVPPRRVRGQIISLLEGFYQEVIQEEKPSRFHLRVVRRQRGAYHLVIDSEVGPAAALRLRQRVTSEATGPRVPSDTAEKLRHHLRAPLHYRVTTLSADLCCFSLDVKITA